MIHLPGTLTHTANPAYDNRADYPEHLKSVFSLAACDEAYAVISQWPKYQSTPLCELRGLASAVDIEKLYYKDESQRFHLKSFKALGGAYAVARVLQDRLQQQTGSRPEIDELLAGRYAELVQEIVISCATDGNHGRSVAWGCQMFGCGCVIYIHRDVSESRAQAMQQFGAKVIRIQGNYDDSIKRADQDARKHNRTIVADTSYEGYLEIPRYVAAGYGVMLKETIEQMAPDYPTHVLVQGGVGGLASAVCAYFWEYWGAVRPRLIVVEPVSANCLQASARQGHPVAVEGDLDTLMAGLACGEVSLLAWRILEPGCHDFMTLSEDAVAPSMRLLADGVGADPKIEAGESAIASVAALILARNDPAMSEQLGLDSSSRVLVIGTEGATDEQVYRELIGG